MAIRVGGRGPGHLARSKGVPANALRSAINGQVLRSAITGQILTSARS